MGRRSRGGAGGGWVGEAGVGRRGRGGVVGRRGRDGNGWVGGAGWGV